MSIFDLHQSVLADYRDFVRSFFLIADDRGRAQPSRYHRTFALPLAFTIGLSRRTASAKTVLARRTKMR
jgi:hypothetical protein